jgi:hypothetical protein
MWCCVAKAQELEWTRIFLDNEFSPDDPCKQAFRLMNTGKQELVIEKLKNSCGCAYVNIDKTRIGPNDIGVVRVMASPKLVKAKGSFSLFIVSNDIKESITRIPINLCQNAAFTFEPGQLELSVTNGVRCKQSATLCVMRADYSGYIVSNLCIKSLSPYIEVKDIPGGRKAEVVKSYEIRLADDLIPEKTITTYLYLTCSVAGREMSRLVTVHVLVDGGVNTDLHACPTCDSHDLDGVSWAPSSPVLPTNGECVLRIVSSGVAGRVRNLRVRSVSNKLTVLSSQNDDLQVGERREFRISSKRESGLESDSQMVQISYNYCGKRFSEMVPVRMRK